jgi:hypothetical protein
MERIASTAFTIKCPTALAALRCSRSVVAFASGTGDFTMQLRRDFFPYLAQSAKTITVDALTLYSGSAGKVASVAPSVDLAALSTGINGATGSATLTLPADAVVMTRAVEQQVFAVLQYHLGM